MGVGNSLLEIIIKLKVVFRDGDGREGHSCSTCSKAQDIMSQLRLELSPKASSTGAVGLWAAAGLVPITTTGALLQWLSSFVGAAVCCLGRSVLQGQGGMTHPLNGASPSCSVDLQVPGKKNMSLGTALKTASI